MARTNVCPVHEPPAEPVFHAFSYTVPDDGEALPSFVVAGGGEAPEGHPNYRDVIVRLGDTSPDGLREKVRYVVAEMTRRLEALGFSWQDAIATQAYTVHDIGPLMWQELVQRRARRAEASPGSSPVRRSSTWSTRWMCAAWRANLCGLEANASNQ